MLVCWLFIGKPNPIISASWRWKVSFLWNRWQQTWSCDHRGVFPLYRLHCSFTWPPPQELCRRLSWLHTLWNNFRMDDLFAWRCCCLRPVLRYSRSSWTTKIPSMMTTVEPTECKTQNTRICTFNGLCAVKFKLKVQYFLITAQKFPNVSATRDWCSSEKEEFKES